MKKTYHFYDWNASASPQMKALGIPAKAELTKEEFYEIIEKLAEAKLNVMLLNYHSTEVTVGIDTKSFSQR